MAPQLRDYANTAQVVPVGCLSIGVRPALISIPRIASMSPNMHILRSTGPATTVPFGRWGLYSANPLPVICHLSLLFSLTPSIAECSVRSTKRALGTSSPSLFKGRRPIHGFIRAGARFQLVRYQPRECPFISFFQPCGTTDNAGCNNGPYRCTSALLTPSPLE